MAIPRLGLLALVGVVLVAGAFAASQLAKKQEESGGLPASPAVKAPAEKPAQKQPPVAKSEPQAPSAPPASKPARTESAQGAPARVRRAMAAGDVVVVYLSQGAADDEATSAAASAVKGLSGVTVVTDSVENVADYRRIVAGVGVTQAPAVVVVDRDGKGRLVEGYVDPESLRQLVADAR